MRSILHRLAFVAEIIAIALLCGWILYRLFYADLNAPIDIAAFWSAGHLNFTGQNPYSGASLRGLQRQIGLNDLAVIMWNPPWTLTLVMPIGALPFHLACGVWELLTVVLVIAATELLWRSFGGPARLRVVAYLVALTFGPTVFLVGSGQITAVVLFGLAGYLYFARNNYPLCAGACSALTAVKPHLLVLFALWLLLEATRSGFGRRVLLGGLLVGLVMSVLPTVTNSAVWGQYINAVSGPSSTDHHHMSEWNPPVVGWWLRQTVPEKPFAVQWIPMLIAVLVFLVWWCLDRNRSPQLEARLPWVVGLSHFVAPYGDYAYDLVLLLISVLATTVRVLHFPSRLACTTGLILLCAVNIALLAMMMAHPPSQMYVWVTPTVLCGCAIVARMARPKGE